MLTTFSSADILILVLFSFLIGLRRGGMQGSGIIAITILVAHFGPMPALGYSLIVFIFADIQAIFIFIKTVNWKLLGQLLLPTVFGVGTAAIAGMHIPEDIYEWVLFFLALSAYAGLMLHKRLKFDIRQPGVRTALVLFFGFVTGFTSMIGNISSLFLTIFFSAIGSSKMHFIATSVWFFFIMNLIKLPIHLFVWETITFSSFLELLILVPVVTVGVLAGKRLSRMMSEKVYWRFALAIAALGIIRLALSLAGII